MGWHFYGKEGVPYALVPASPDTEGTHHPVSHRLFRCADGADVCQPLPVQRGAGPAGPPDRQLPFHQPVFLRHQPPAHRPGKFPLGERRRQRPDADSAERFHHRRHLAVAHRRRFAGGGRGTVSAGPGGAHHLRKLRPAHGRAADRPETGRHRGSRRPVLRRSDPVRRIPAAIHRRTAPDRHHRRTEHLHPAFGPERAAE